MGKNRYIDEKSLPSIYLILFIEFGYQSTYLQKLDVFIWPNDQCQTIYGPYYISDPNICITGKSACHGDSGGPLTVEVRNILKKTSMV